MWETESLPKKFEEFEKGKEIESGEIETRNKEMQTFEKKNYDYLKASNTIKTKAGTRKHSKGKKKNTTQPPVCLRTLATYLSAPQS